MQRSYSMHVSPSAGDLDVLTNATAQSLNSPNGTTVISRTVSSNALANGAAIDILDVPLRPYPINGKKSKPDTSSRFRRETYVHSIPLIVLFAYFCLWIASSGPDTVRSTQLEQ